MKIVLAMAREEEEKRHLSLGLKDARDLEGHSQVGLQSQASTAVEIVTALK